jgi:hypothetical protein
MQESGRSSWHRNKNGDSRTLPSGVKASSVRAEGGYELPGATSIGRQDILITSDNICHIKSLGIGADWSSLLALQRAHIGFVEMDF